MPSLVEPISEGTLRGIILWFALKPLCAEDSSNIGNCHFIRRRILRKASVRLSFSSPHLLRYTIVSNEERMVGEFVERVLHEGLRESAIGGGWSEHGGNITTAFSPSTSQRSAFCNDLTKLILIFERRSIEWRFENWVSRENHAYKRHEQRPISNVYVDYFVENDSIVMRNGNICCNEKNKLYFLPFSTSIKIFSSRDRANLICVCLVL